MITSMLERAIACKIRAVESLLPAVLGRAESLFAADWRCHESAVGELLGGRRVLVVGGAGSIGSEVVRQLVQFAPTRVVVVDSSENNLVELVRSVRSGPPAGYKGELVCYPLDFGSQLGLQAMEGSGPYDVMLNFAALKHVRSEKDIYSLLHMLDTNVVKLRRLLEMLSADGCGAAFSVSSDKAVRPVSLMGASKRLMELVLFGFGGRVGRTCSGRFANVAFSDGSLLDGFMHRVARGEPLAGPSDVRRYFMSGFEAAQLCLLSAATGADGEIFVPRVSERLAPRGFEELAETILEQLGFEAAWYDWPEQARDAMEVDLARGRYPCCFGPSNTAGEKPLEEFAGPDEQLDGGRFEQLDVVVHGQRPPAEQIKDAVARLEKWSQMSDGQVGKQDVVDVLRTVVPELAHVESETSLDQKM